jgi:hypothetical protein
LAESVTELRRAGLISEPGVEPRETDFVNGTREAVRCAAPVGLYEQPGDLGGCGDRLMQSADFLSAA